MCKWIRQTSLRFPSCEVKGMAATQMAGDSCNPAGSAFVETLSVEKLNL